MRCQMHRYKGRLNTCITSLNDPLQAVITKRCHLHSPLFIPSRTWCLNRSATVTSRAASLSGTNCTVKDHPALTVAKVAM